MRSRVLKRTVLAAVAAAVWTHMPQAALRLRRLSLKCWFMGHDDWIRRTPDRLYLECFECGRETQGWATGKSHRTDGAAGCIDNARVIRREGASCLRWSVRQRQQRPGPGVHSVATSAT